MKRKRKDLTKHSHKGKKNSVSNINSTKKTRKKKARKRNRLIKKFILMFKIVILSLATAILLGLFALGLIWSWKYIVTLYHYTIQAIHAWYNFFTYLEIPQDVKRKFFQYIKGIGIGLSILLISVILFRSLLFTFRILRKHKLQKMVQSTKTIKIKKKALQSSNNAEHDKVITLTRNDILDLPVDSNADNTSEIPENQQEKADDETSKEEVILLGPSQKNIIKRDWDMENIERTSDKKIIKFTPIKQPPKIKGEVKKEKRKEDKQKRENIPIQTNSSPIDLISYTPPDYVEKIRPEAEYNAEIIIDILAEFGINGEIDQLQIGPRVSRYEIKIPKGTRVDKIKRLTNDIAIALGVRTIRMELSVPRKPQTIAIEVPNSTSGTVHISSIVKTEIFKAMKTPTPLVLGLDVKGHPIIEDLRRQPHLLIAGATGSGKSVCINTILTGMLVKSSPQTLKLMLIDPKRVELSTFSHLPHLLFPILTEANEAVAGLEWMLMEMDRRYKILKESNVRSIEAYNAQVEEIQKLPYIVIVIDELADLMMVSAKDTEQKIARLAQLARAAGIHLIIATQRPSTDVITGLIKANIPARIAFAVSSQVDSRVILDTIGAEKLLGMGDMLFVSPRYRHPIRIQGAYTSDEDIENVVNYWSRRYPQKFKTLNIVEFTNLKNKKDNKTSSDLDPLIRDAWRLIVDHNRPSISFIQRKLRIGFNRASRIMEQLEDLGIVSPPEGPQGKRHILRTDYNEDLHN